MPNGATCAGPGGDRLDRAEFRRRYEAQPHDRKAELIGGIVYVASPVRFPHAKQHASLIGLLHAYALATPGVVVVDNATLVATEQDEPQPDVALSVLPEHGGLGRIDEEQYLHGPVELVAEVSPSSVSKDLHLKRDLYQTLGCQEYLVHVVEEPGAVHWMRLEGGRYRDLTAEDGVLCSRVYPGLWLDVVAYLAGDARAVDATLRRGLATPAHEAFVADLARRRTSSEGQTTGAAEDEPPGTG